MSTDSLPAATRLGLDRSQIVALVAVGAALWFVAATLLRLLAPVGIHAGWAQVLTYALVVPGTVPVVLLVRRVAGLAPNRIGIGMAVATAAATLLDGLALAWMPWLYGTELAHTAGAGAVILWGAGVGLVLGFLFNRDA